METDYYYEIKLRVKINAFDKSDADDIIADIFGAGEDGAVYVESVAVKSIKPKSC